MLPKTETQHQANANLPAHEVLVKLPPTLLRHAYVVGGWTWIEFDGGKRATRAEAKLLNELGFKYSKTRGAYQHRGGNNRPESEDDPRLKYGVIDVGTFLNGGGAHDQAAV